MKHSARQDRVDGETDSALHAKKAGQRVVLDDSLLQPTHVLRGRIAEQHVLLPHRVKRLVVEVQLRSMVHDDAEVVVAVQVRNIVRWDPRRSAVCRIVNLQVAGKLPSPCCISIIHLDKRRFDRPVLRLLAKGPVEDCRLLDVPYDAQHVSELTGNRVLRLFLA